MEYSAKKTWQSAEKAAAYRHSRTPDQYKRYFAEDQILKGWLVGLPPQSRILDIPCGTGRLAELLNSLEHRYVSADFSRAMLKEAKSNEAAQGSVGFVNADAEHLPFADQSFDCVILWRFMHHIADPKVRLHILSEAARVAKDRVLLSFYHPISFTYLRRVVQHKMAGKTDYRAAITQWRLAKDASQCGLKMVSCCSFRRYISINWFACLKHA